MRIVVRSILATSALALSALALVPAHAATGREGRDGTPSQERSRADAAEPTALIGTDADPTDSDVPGTFIIDAKDNLDDAQIAELSRDLGVMFRATGLEKETREELITLTDHVDETLARIAHDPRVEGVEPLAKVRMLFVPNDPLYKEQWHMDRIGAPRAWDYATGRGVVVAVVDTGIACEDHDPFVKLSDLEQTACVGGWNFVTNNEHANDDQGHGTHVAGTIAQSTDNGLGAVGVAFHARLMPVKVLNESGWGTTADVADGIRWAAEHGADVINLSLGGSRNSSVLQKAVDFALSKGVVVVAAAGNSGGAVGYPGASEGVIGVSASDPDDKIAKFSSRGPAVDIAAPGVSVTQQTICKKGREKCENYPAYNGTSMASPHVAGAAALVMSLGVTDPAAVEAALKTTARVIDGSDGAKKLYGAGVLDVASATLRITMNHVLFRFVALFLLTAAIAASARKLKKNAASPWKLSYWIPALAAGPGLFFFAPFVMSRANAVVDVLARPIADLDLLVGVGLHKWLPLANAAIPFALTTVFFGAKKLRPAIAGLATGTAAYLASVVALGEVAGPFGKVATLAWGAVNILGCLWIARTNLAETD
jgi:serine protease